jgi:hypothetical protein
MLGQRAAVRLATVASVSSARVPGRRGENPRHSGQAGREGGCNFCRRRRRLPSDALVKLDVVLGLGEAVPVRQRLEGILPGGWVSCDGAANARARDGSGRYPSEGGLRSAGGPARWQTDVAARRFWRGRDAATRRSIGPSCRRAGGPRWSTLDREAKPEAQRPRRSGRAAPSAMGREP